MGAERNEIAARVAELRGIEEIAVGDLCAELGFSRGDYEKWEAAEADFPVGALVEIAARFGVDLNELVTGEAAKLTTYCLYRAGEAPLVSRRPQFSYRNLAYTFHKKRAEPFLVEAAADTETKPLSLNTHPGQEFDYVLEGRLFFSVGGHEMELGPGDSIYYDSREAHGMRATGGAAAKFLAFVF